MSSLHKDVFELLLYFIEREQNGSLFNKFSQPTISIDLKYPSNLQIRIVRKSKITIKSTWIKDGFKTNKKFLMLLFLWILISVYKKELIFSSVFDSNSKIRNRELFIYSYVFGGSKRYYSFYKLIVSSRTHPSDL